MDLANRCIQLLLTAIGFRPDSLTPRIDVFGYSAIELGYLLAAGGFLLVTRVARSWLEVTVLGMIVLTPYFDPGIWGFNVLLQPDYPNWIVAIMLVTTWAIVWSSKRYEIQWSLADFLIVTCLTAVALATKATLVVYPASLALTLISTRRNFLRSLLLTLCSAICGLMGWLFILLAYFRFRIPLVGQFFHDELKFGSSVRPSLPYLNWLQQSLHSADWLLKVDLILPAGLVALLAFPRIRSKAGTISGLIAGSLAYHAALYFRYQPITWFEATAYSVSCVVVVLLIGIDRPKARSTTLGYVFLALLSASVSYGGYRYILRDYRVYLTNLTAAQSQASTTLKIFDDRIAFLLPDNSYRPLTVDSAIWKGGSNILDGNRFGASPLVKSMFPCRAYFSESPEWYQASPQDLKRFKAIVFTIRVGIDPPPADQLALMSRRFNFPPADLHLYKNIDFGSQRFLVWTWEDLGSDPTLPKELEAFNLRARRSSPSQIQLSWKPTASGIAFEIEMRTGNQFGAQFQSIGTAPGQTGHYSINDVSPMSFYSFRIREIKDAKRSSPSDPVDVPLLSSKQH